MDIRAARPRRPRVRVPRGQEPCSCCGAYGSHDSDPCVRCEGSGSVRKGSTAPHCPGEAPRRRTASSATPEFTFTHERKQTGGIKYPYKIDLYAHHPDTGEVAGKLRYCEPKRKGAVVTADEFIGETPHKGASSALLNEMERRHPGSKTVFMNDLHEKNKPKPGDPDFNPNRDYGLPTDWDKHYPALPGTVHRGLGIRINDHYDLRTLNDPSVPVNEQAHVLKDSVRQHSSAGMHWSADPKQAIQFAHRNINDPRVEMPVVIHADTPTRNRIETRPQILRQKGVWPHDHSTGDAEVPIKKRAPVSITGLSWYPDYEHPAADQHGWVHHNFDEPIEHTALLLTPRILGDTIGNTDEYQGGRHAGQDPRHAGRGKPRHRPGGEAAPGAGEGAPGEGGAPGGDADLGAGQGAARPVELHPQAAKDLSKLDKPDQSKIKATIESLAAGEPTQTHPLTGPLKGWKSTKASRGHRVVHRDTDEGSIHVGYIGLHDYDTAIRRLTTKERHPHDLALAYAQQEVRKAHPELGIELPPSEMGASRHLQEMLRQLGHPRAEEAFVIKHPDSSRQVSQVVADGETGAPGVAIHPARWDFGTLAHEVAHISHADEEGRDLSEPLDREHHHGPVFADHYRRAIETTLAPPEAGMDFIRNYRKARRMLQANPEAFTFTPHQAARGIPCDTCHGSGKESYGERSWDCRTCGGSGVFQAADHWDPPKLTPEQQDIADDEDYRSHNRRALDLAKNPVPGTHVWRSEIRHKDDVSAPDTVGMHWTVKPEMVILGHSTPEQEGYTTDHRHVVWQGVVDHPDQTIPRGHPIWRGRHQSLDSEAEIRFKPGAKVRLNGAYVWNGGGKTHGHPVPRHSERTNAGWDFHPLDHEAEVAHKRPADGMMEYQESYPDLFKKDSAHKPFYTDWDRVHPTLPETVHRGAGLFLSAEDHRFVHDPAQPAHKRAERLMEVMHEGSYTGGIGKHWSTDPWVAHHFAAKEAGRAAVGGIDEGQNAEYGMNKEYGEPNFRPGTMVMLHAKTPAREHMDEGHHDVWGRGIDYETHYEKETPLQAGSPVHVTGLSWGHENDPSGKDEEDPDQTIWEMDQPDEEDPQHDPQAAYPHRHEFPGGFHTKAMHDDLSLAERRDDHVLLHRGVGEHDGKTWDGKPYATAEDWHHDAKEDRPGFGPWWGADEELAKNYGDARDSGMMISAWFPQHVIRDSENHTGVIVPVGTEGHVHRVQVKNGRGENDWKDLPHTPGMKITSAQVPFNSHEDYQAFMDHHYGPDAGQSGKREPHPRSGYSVEVGEHRRIARPPKGQDEGPAVWNISDHGRPTDSLAQFPKRDIRQEPIEYVYRGVGEDEWKQAQERGYLRSDQRGTIADWEGTNAATDPQSAVSYLPVSGKGHVLKIRVHPDEKWFTIPHDSYVRTREQIPLSRVEHVSPLIHKDEKTHLSYEGMMPSPGDGPLPIEPGKTWYRMHYKPRAWSDATSAEITPYSDGKQREEETRKPGFSAMDDPHELHRYLDDMGWYDHADDSDAQGRSRWNKHVVVQFRGEDSGRTGVNGEPLVMPGPKADRIEMPLDEFRKRLHQTPRGDEPGSYRDKRWAPQKAMVQHLIDHHAGMDALSPHDLRYVPAWNLHSMMHEHMPEVEHGHEGLHAQDPYPPIKRRYSSLTAMVMPTERIFGPTFGLDHRLFDVDEHLLPEVRRTVLSRLDEVLRPVLGPHWMDFTEVYLAGSEASEWTGPDLEGNGDFDTLLGLDYDATRAAVPEFAHATPEAIDQALNLLLKTSYNKSGWRPPFGGVWDLTGYFNQDSLDIKKIKPYAAYDISKDEWAVHSPHLPTWGPESFPAGPAMWKEAEAVVAYIEAILTLPEPYRTQQGTALYDHLHSDRSRAFGPNGEGWMDPGNVLEKYLDQTGYWAKLLKLKQRSEQKTAGARGDLPEGISYEHELKDGIHTLYARHPDMPGDKRFAGVLGWWDKDGEVGGIEVHPQMQRRGLGTELFRRAKEITPHIHHSESLTPEATQWISGMEGKTASSGLELRTRSGKRKGISHTTISAHAGDQKVGHVRMTNQGREVDDLHVVPQVRGQGVAHLLMDEALRQFGDNTIRLHASPFGKDGLDKDALQGFYASHGFEPEPERGDGYMIRLPQTEESSLHTASDERSDAHARGEGFVQWQHDRDPEEMEKEHEAPSFLEEDAANRRVRFDRQWNVMGDDERQRYRDKLKNRAAKKMFIGTNHAGRILRDGRMKSLAEMHDGNDVLFHGHDENYLYDRHAYERHVMGVDDDLPAHERPIYGSVHDSPGENTSYGHAHLELKPHVRKRTTVTMGDSMDHTLRPYGIDHLHKLDDDQLKEMTSAEDIEQAHQREPNTYMEFQVHGGVHRDDVAALHVHGDLDHIRDVPAIKIAHRYGIPVFHHEFGQATPLTTLPEHLAAKGAVRIDLGRGYTTDWQPGMGSSDTVTVSGPEGAHETTWGALIAMSNGEILQQTSPDRQEQKTAAWDDIDYSKPSLSPDGKQRSTDWDHHYGDIGPSIYRGIKTRLPDELHSFVHDSARPTQERAHALMDHLRLIPETNMHWTSDKGVASAFSNGYTPSTNGSPPPFNHEDPDTTVIMEADRPEREHIETDPQRLLDREVLTHHGLEKEVPLKQGMPVNVRKITWKPANSLGYATHHEFDEPQRHQAGLKGDLSGVTFEHIPPEYEHMDTHTLVAHHPGASDGMHDNEAAHLKWWPDTGAIANIKVHPDYQRRGIGSELYRRAREITPHLDLTDVLSDAARKWIPSLERSGSLTLLAEGLNDEYVTCDQGHGHWGSAGAAGMLVRHRGEDGEHRYLLQKRAPWVDHPNTWSIPGGAIDENETPQEAAHRESEEELGELPSLKHSHTITDDHGGWAYHTVVAESPERFTPQGDGVDDNEHEGHGWFTHKEMQQIPLHPGFRKTWDRVRTSHPGNVKKAGGGGGFLSHHRAMEYVENTMKRDPDSPHRFDMTDPEDINNHYEHADYIDGRNRAFDARWRRLEPSQQSRIQSLIHERTKHKLIVGMPPKAAIAMLDQGRFQNVHEAFNKDVQYMKGRRAYEDHVMGLHGVPDHERPIYGSLHENPADNVYGAYRAELHDSVRPRTTVTGGDSMNHVLHNYPIGRIKDLNHSQLRSTVSEEDMPTLGKEGELPEWSYTEFQVHGGLGRHEIKKFHVPEDEPDDSEVMQRLRHHGIEIVRPKPDPNHGLTDEQIRILKGTPR